MISSNQLFHFKIQYVILNLYHNVMIHFVSIISLLHLVDHTNTTVKCLLSNNKKFFWVAVGVGSYISGIVY